MEQKDLGASENVDGQGFDVVAERYRSRYQKAKLVQLHMFPQKPPENFTG